MALLKLAALGALGYAGYKYYEKQKGDRRAAFAHEVDQHLGAAAVGERTHLLHLGAVRQDAVVGPDRFGEFKGGGVAVHHDDPARRERLQHLDADVAQAPGADHHADVPWRQPLRRLGRGVVGRQAGVRQGRHVRRFQRIVDLHD